MPELNAEYLLVRGIIATLDIEDREYIESQEKFLTGWLEEDQRRVLALALVGTQVSNKE